MATIAIFPSVLGIRRSITNCADMLRGAGHIVTIVDFYEGRSFSDYEEAMALSESIGLEVLMERALSSVKNMTDGFYVIGFSNGSGLAQYVALNRQVSGAVLCAGALPIDMLGYESWPAGVPAMIHQTVNDPWTDDGFNETFMRAVASAGADCEYILYPGNGHLFMDADLPDEYDAAATERFEKRVKQFLDGA